jgi:hypothetical protein
MLYSAGYCFILFVVEGEGEGTGLDQGIAGIISILPLFLFIFIASFIFLGIPISMALNALVRLVRTKRR